MSVVACSASLAWLCSDVQAHTAAMVAHAYQQLQGINFATSCSFLLPRKPVLTAVQARLRRWWGLAPSPGLWAGPVNGC